MHTPHWSDHSFAAANTLTTGEVHIWRFPLDLEPPAGAKLLSPAEKQQLAWIQRPLAARRYQNTRFHLRSILASYLATEPAMLEFAITPGGKPRLEHSLLQFNLSHSHELGLLAISARHPVGVDLEKIRGLKYAPNIARRLFPKEVQKQLSGMDGNNQQLLFFQQWTAMEARQKTLGRGIFDTTVASDAMHCQQFMAAHDFVATVATESIHEKPALEFFNCSREAYDAA
ncbi:4'-phosphopantetheinyl transferase family protein [Thiolapillus sp.]